MSARVRALIGVLTTVVFLSIALILYSEQRYTACLLLGSIGVFRGAVAVRQLSALRTDAPPPAG